MTITIEKIRTLLHYHVQGKTKSEANFMKKYLIID